VTNNEVKVFGSGCSHADIKKAFIEGYKAVDILFTSELGERRRRELVGEIERLCGISKCYIAYLANNNRHVRIYNLDSLKENEDFIGLLSHIDTII
jgi:hypothetical protein